MKKFALDVVKKIASTTQAFKAFSFRNFSFPRELHAAMQPLFKRYGYVLETHAFGKRHLGLWRKKIREVEHPRVLFMVPGFGDTPLSWLMVLIPLRNIIPDYYDEVVFLDYPGFQGFLSGDRAFDSMDELVKAFIVTIDKLRPHTVFAHSLGSWLLAYAAIHEASLPEPYLKKAIFISSPAVIPNRDDIIRWAGKFQLAKQQNLDEFRKFLFVTEPLFFSFFAKEFQNFFGKKEVIDFINSIGLHHFLADQLCKIRSEVALIWGRGDELNLAAWAEGWYRCLDGTKTGSVPLVLIDGVGHNLHIENPAAVSTVVGKIITNHQLTHSHKWTMSTRVPQK